MTSTSDNSLIDLDDPLNLTVGKPLTAQQVQALQQQERVRQRLAASYSSSPLHRARAAKDPEYWSKLSGGSY